MTWDIVSAVEVNTAPKWNHFVVRGLEEFALFVVKNEDLRVVTTFHRQPGIEIHITQQGRAAFLAGDQVFLQAPMQVALLRGDVPHRVVADPGVSYTRTVICFDPSKLQLLGSDLVKLVDLAWFPERPTNVQLTPAQFREIENLSRTIWEEVEHGPLGWVEMSLACFVRVSLLLRRLVESDVSRPFVANIDAMTASHLVHSVAEYVNSENLGSENVSLPHVAGLFGVSPEI